MIPPHSHLVKHHECFFELIQLSVSNLEILLVFRLPISPKPIPNKYVHFIYKEGSINSLKIQIKSTLKISIKSMSTLTENLEVRGMAAEQVLQPRHCLQAVV